MMVEQEADGARAVGECIFCSIAAGVMPADLVFEDEETFFFHDISPKAPVHVLGVPKRHIASLAAIDGELQVVGTLLTNMVRVAEQLGVAEDGYRVLTNVGHSAGQEVPHLHWHLLGGERLGPIN